MSRAAVVALVVALAASACSDEQMTAPSPESVVKVGDAPDSEGVTTLEGVLFANAVTGDEVLLCAAASTEQPPQCAGDSLRVIGLDLSSVPHLAHVADVLWTWPPVVLRGSVKGGELQSPTVPPSFEARASGGAFSLGADAEGDSARLVVPGQVLDLAMSTELTSRVTVKGSNGGSLVLRPKDCSEDGDCSDARIEVDTSSMKPGTFQTTVNGTALQITVRPAANPSSWPPVCCVGDAVNTTAKPGTAP